jgi:hypothetical protein
VSHATRHGSLKLKINPRTKPDFFQKEKTMKMNVGGVDRILRIVAGLVLIGLTLAGQIGVWGWIGLLPLLTGIFRFCPAYTLFGMNTCSMNKK